MSLKPRWAYFPVTAQVDDTVTCIACGRAKCELSIEVFGNGRHSWCGIHKECLKRHERRARKEIPDRYDRLMREGDDELLAEEYAAQED